MRRSGLLSDKPVFQGCGMSHSECQTTVVILVYFHVSIRLVIVPKHTLNIIKALHGGKPGEARLINPCVRLKLEIYIYQLMTVKNVT